MRFVCSSILFILVCGLLACQPTSSSDHTTTTATSTPSAMKNKFAIVIHGGAGTILKKNMTPQKEEAYRQKLEEAIRLGYEILAKGGTSLDAVEAVICILEDSPLFNAGKGAVFTADEINELDASIMEGSSKKAGAIAGVTHVKNPIRLARKVMENSPHVLLTRQGAEEFAKLQGIELVETSYFYTEERYQSLKKLQTQDSSQTQLDHDTDTLKDSKFGTVGCVALDMHGTISAGTSTGGMTNKKWGRVGDSPIIGAGTYANNATCGVSATGWGEFFIRNVVAYDISALMEYKNLSLADAAKEVIQNKLSALGGDGGIIAIDKNGSIVMEFNTAGMYRASMNEKGDLYVGIYEN